MTFQEIEKQVKADKWKEVREIDSYHQYRKIGVDYPLIIPDCQGEDLPICILMDLEKRTGLPLRR